jgi:hypothetical protein
MARYSSLQLIVNHLLYRTKHVPQPSTSASWKRPRPTSAALSTSLPIYHDTNGTFDGTLSTSRSDGYAASTSPSTRRLSSSHGACPPFLCPFKKSRLRQPSNNSRNTRMSQNRFYWLRCQNRHRIQTILLRCQAIITRIVIKAGVEKKNWRSCRRRGTRGSKRNHGDQTDE